MPLIYFQILGAGWIYGLISTANPVKFISKRAGLAVVINWWILNSFLWQNH